MTVQARTEELGQNVNVIQAAVDAIADGDVDEPVAPGQRHGRLAAHLGERKQPGPATASEDQAKDAVHGWSNPAECERHSMPSAWFTLGYERVGLTPRRSPNRYRRNSAIRSARAAACSVQSLSATP